MRRLTAALALVAGIMAAPSVQAQSRTATLKVVATVVADCLVTPQALAFGAYDPVDVNRTQPLDGTAQLSVVCTKGTIASIELGDGRHAAGQTRRLAGPGGAFLRYDLYSDAGRLARWGVQAGRVQLPASPSTAPRVLSVYGRIPPNQDVVVGDYLDEVVVTIKF